MKRSDAAEIWALFTAAYAEGLRWLEPKQREHVASLYIDFLVDLDYDAAGPAVRRLIATWTPTSANRYPPIPVVRAAVLAQREGRPRSGLEAWADVKALTGAYEQSKLDEIDPAVRECIEGLGWVRWHPFYSAARGEFRKWTVCSDSDNEASDRARFCERYDEIAEAAREDAIVGQLAPPLPRRQLGGRVLRLLPEPKESA